MPSRADFLAAQLRKDPVYVTDNAPERLPPGTAARIKASVSRLGVPVYLVVALMNLSRTDADQADTLVPLLHDRLGKDGIYIVAGPDGFGAAQQYGGSLPVAHAWDTTDRELPSRPGVVKYIDHFVELLRSGHAEDRYRNPQRAPETTERATPDPYDEKDRKETQAVELGSVLSALPLLGLLIFRRLRKRPAAARARKGNT
ncbi:MAG: hypothetical protein JWN52_4822 [Actinomycetia bacterium]|nr:hypothetical protein [Actinomycetes bacterium]